MADFPSSPNLNDIFTAPDGTDWTWTGSVWKALGYPGGGGAGAQGATGSQGVQGAQGVQGSSGSLGIQGAQGVQGATGSGAQGVQGSQGIQGSTGIQVGKHMIPIMSSSMLPSVVTGCASLSLIATSSGHPDLVTLDFDPTTQEYAQFSIIMPSSWDEGTITFKPVWSHDTTTVNFGVVWELQAVAVSNDETIDVAFGTAQSSTDTGGTANRLYVGPESSSITVGGTPSAGDTVFFRITRNTGSGSDTMAVDARLHGIHLFLTTDAGIDS